MTKPRNRSPEELLAEQILFNAPSPERKARQRQTGPTIGELAVNTSLAELNIDPTDIFDFRSLLQLLNSRVYGRSAERIWEQYEGLDEYFRTAVRPGIILRAPQPLYALGPIIPNLNMTQLQKLRHDKEILIEHSKEALILSALPQILDLPDAIPQAGKVTVIKAVTQDILETM